MNCREFEEHVTAFVEECLEGSLKRIMEEHCASCQKCARLVELHQIILTSLNTTEPVRAPEGLANRIFAAAESEAPGSVVKFPSAEKAAFEADTHGTPAFDCRAFENNIAAYVDGLIKGDLLCAMEKHRAACPACERLAKAHEAVLFSLNNAEPIPAPEGMAEHILAAVEAEATATVNPFRKYGLLTAASAAAALIIAASISIISSLARQFSTTGGLSISPGDVWAQITAFPLLLKAWIVGNISGEQWTQIILLLEPVELPFFSLSFPLYYLPAFIIMSWYAWSYFRTDDIPGMVPVSYHNMAM